jgi:hypothetical protein
MWSTYGVSTTAAASAPSPAPAPAPPITISAAASARSAALPNTPAGFRASALASPHLAPSVEEAFVARELKEVWSRYTARRNALYERVSEARDKLIAVQKALKIANTQAEEAGAASAEVRALEAAVARAGDRVAVMRLALNQDEAALAARLKKQADTVRLLREENDVASAALSAAQLEAEAAANVRSRPDEIDIKELEVRARAHSSAHLSLSDSLQSRCMRARGRSTQFFNSHPRPPTRARAAPTLCRQS